VEYGLAHALAWEHGVWFVDLSRLSDPAEIEPAVADAVGVSLAAGSDPRSAVVDHLRQRHTMVIVDNCEQFVTEVAVCVNRIMTTCSRVSFLATSREALGLRYEHTWHIPRLEREADAVQLFADRAGLGANIDTSLRSDIVDLCHALDGLPLAIELAAARSDVMSPTEIRARIERHNVLRSRDPVGPTRSRSLDDTIRWSYDLLTEDEQRVFRRLGAFAAGFGLEEATAASADPTLDPYDVPDHVWSLVSKSVVAREVAAGSTRYRMLETIRAFARRQLEQTHELGTVAVRLAHHYLDAYGPGVDKLDLGLLSERGRNIDNIRALVDDVPVDQVQLAQALAWIVLQEHRRTSPRSGLDEALRFLERLPAATTMRVGLLTEAAGLAGDQGNLDHDSRLLDEAVSIAHVTGSPTWTAGQVEQERGVIALQRGDPVLARRIALQALRSVNEPAGRARVLNLFSMASTELGSFDEARDAAEQSLEVADELQNTAMRAGILGTLAEIELRAGRSEAGAQRQLQCLTIALQLGSTQDVAYAVSTAARLAHEHGDSERAARLQSAADSIMVAIGITLLPSDRLLCDHVLAAAHANLGQPVFDEACKAGRDADITEALRDARAVLEAVAAAR
jgi:non-specific serine/threonine protein kinase